MHDLAVLQAAKLEADRKTVEYRAALDDPDRTAVDAAEQALFDVLRDLHNAVAIALGGPS